MEDVGNTVLCNPNGNCLPKGDFLKIILNIASKHTKRS